MRCPTALLAAALLAGSADAALAQDATPGHGQWTVELGGAARLRPKRLGSDLYTEDLLPVLEASYGTRIHISIDDGARWTAIKAGRFSLGPVAEYRQPYTSGLPPRARRVANAVETGVFSQVNLTYAVLEGRFRKALTGYDGYSGDISLDTLVPLRPRLGLGLEARAGWADRRFTQAQFANQFIIPAQTSDFWSGGVQGGLIYHTRSGYGFTAAVSDDEILRPSRDLARYRTRNAATLTLAVTRRFSGR